MIQINNYCLGINHYLVPKIDLKNWPVGEVKECWVMVYTDKRVAVMGNWDHKNKRPDGFYQLFKNIDEVHETFNEQLTIPFK